MNRTLALLLALILVFSFSGCGKKQSAPEAAPASSAGNPSVAQSTAAPGSDAPNPAPAEAPAPVDPYAAATSEAYSFAYYGPRTSFSEGVAWVTLTSKPQQQPAIINKNGEVLYTFDRGRLNLELNQVAATSFEGGVSAVYNGDENKYNPSSGFLLMNTEGEVIYESSDPAVYLCGKLPDARYLVARHESGFYGDQWFYSLLSPDLTFSDTELECPADKFYPESGIWQLSDSLLYLNSIHLFLNFANGSVFGCNAGDTSYGGVIYLGQDGAYALFQDLNDNDEEYEIIPVSALETVSSYEELQELLYSDMAILAERSNWDTHEGLAYYGLEEGCTVDWSLQDWGQSGLYRVVKESFGSSVILRDYIDLDGNELFVFPSFPQGISYWEVLGHSDGNTALLLLGADQKLYVTLADGAGNLLYDPVDTGLNINTVNSESYFSFCKGYIFNTFFDELEIIDPQGTVRHLGDDLSGLRGVSFFSDPVLISDDYIFFNSAKIPCYASVDGSTVLTGFSANYNAEGRLLYTGADGAKRLSAQVNPDYIVSQTQGPEPSGRVYLHPDKFSIEGKWKNVGSYTYGQAQAGAILVFDGTNCNFFSPNDTYAFYKDGEDFRLDCTSAFFSDTVSFPVRILDENNIDIYNGSDILELTRVS